MNKFLLAVFAATILTACSSEELPVTPPKPPVKNPRVNLNGPTQVNPGWFMVSWQASEVDSCSAPWTTNRSISGQDSVRVTTDTWISILCDGSNGAVRDSLFVRVLAPRRIVVIVQYVTPEGVTYTPDTISLTLRNLGIETVVRVLDTTSIVAPSTYGDTVSFSIPGNDQYYPVIATVPRASFSVSTSSSDTISVVRIPREWTIERGMFAGQTIPISLKAAYDTAPDGTSLFGIYTRKGLRQMSNNPGYWFGNYNWSKISFPVKLVLNRNADTSYIMSAQDSIDLWNSANAMEEKYGRDLFYPGEMSSNTLDASIRVWIDTRNPTPMGGPLPTLHEDGRIESDAGIFASTPRSRFSNPYVFEHEILHVFGHGHSCVWSSTLGANCPMWDEPIVYPAPEKDVAHFELFLSVNTTRRQYRALYHWGANLNGERKERGLSLEPVRYSLDGIKPR